ncbi:MAG: ATP/GTP-binding protein [Actinobacteria bacterium]|nr:ATP/GTP-binding protein [Actinomycetota bacterium]
MGDILDSVRGGDRQALSRAISLGEQGVVSVEAEMAPVVGITGPPGVGKSTLVAALIPLMRSRGETVGVVAVDPSSPLTGGALLGDRIRMQRHIEDDGVFIRSMATRGHLGGLAPATATALRLMTLAGLDRLIVETVGVGQSEVEVVSVADVVVVVLGPSWGDGVQAEKAGVLEIADIVVVNKADRPGAEEVRNALRESSPGRHVLMTKAITGEGVAELLAAIDRLAGV